MKVYILPQIWILFYLEEFQESSFRKKVLFMIPMLQMFLYFQKKYILERIYLFIMKKFLPVFFLFVFLYPVRGQEKENFSEAFQLIETWLQAQKDYEQLPGITASVVEDQEIIWNGSFGQANPEGSVSAKPETLFSICSISKLFTSVAIMQLYDQGKLRLDDRISELLPWYDLEQKFPSSGPITVRNLLTHSSGLPREANFPYWTAPNFEFPGRKKIIEGLEQQETLYPSSTYLQYSNLGLTLLGEVVEEVSGVPYEQYVQNNILTPLRLEQTRTELPEDLYGQELAVGYGALEREGGRDKINLFDANGLKAAAGYSSNVLDLSKFAMWQFRLLDSHQKEILKPSTLENMHNVHWTDPDFSSTWGLGFSVWKGPDGKKWVSHGGSCPGYRTVLQLNPSEKRAYVVMINAGGTSPSKYAAGLNAILEKYEQAETTPGAPDRQELQQFSGYYSTQPWGSEVYITPWKGKLAVMDLPTDNPAKGLTLYQHVKGDIFRRIRDNGALGEELVFERDAAGDIFRYKTHGNYYPKIKR